MSETRQDPGEALSGQQIARVASLIMSALVLSALLGLVRQAAIGGAFGAGRELDAFYAALRVPETLFTLVAGGALGSAFIPVFARFLSDDEFDGAWQLASAILSLVVLGGVVISGVAFIFAEPIVANLLIPSADDASQALTVELMRIMLITVVIFGASGLLMGILNSYQHFLAPALAPSLYNIGLIIGALGLAPSYGVHGLAWGAVIGAGLHLVIQLPVVLRQSHIKLRFSLNWRLPGVSEVLLLMGPRVLGLSIVQINFWVNAALTSGMDDGSLTALTVAFTLMFTVLGVLGQSVGTAVFPTLSRLYAEDELSAFAATFLSALRGVLFLSIPAGLGLAVMANPLITVLFERGEWSGTDTAGTAWALALFSIGLAGHAALEILARTFYALHDTWTPVKIGGLTMVLNITLSLIFITLYPDEADFAQGPFGGLALAMSIATAIESSILLFLLRRRVPYDANLLGGYFWRVMAASLVMLGVVGGFVLLSDAWPTLIVLLVGIVLGGLSFWGMAFALRLEEARRIPETLISRLQA